MSIQSYIENGEIVWRVYLNYRSKIEPTIRVQKRIQHLKTKEDAEKYEKKLSHELREKMARLEKRGSSWEAIIDYWEMAMREDKFSKTDPATVMDYANALRNWTGSWFKRPASEITRGDVKFVFERMEECGKKKATQIRIKNIINAVYKWAIEERIISEAHGSPAKGFTFKIINEKAPEIYTLTEIRTLLSTAKNL